MAPERTGPLRRMSRWIALAFVSALILYVCTRPTIMETLKWSWYMTQIDEYGLIGMHLEPGREYYFPPSAPYFDEDYFQVRPVDAIEVETHENVGIGVVRFDQKRDHMYGYGRVRSEYPGPIDVTALHLVVNGEYFFSVSEKGEIEKRVTIDEAIRLPKYVKLKIYLQKVARAELVTRIGETHLRFTYWPSTKNRKEVFSYTIEDGRRTDYHECYSESDGTHTPCTE